MNFTAETYKQRREKLASLMEPASLALFLSNESQHRNADVEQKFRQDSSFWYLTGFNEPDAALLVIKTKIETKSVIFARPREKEKEIWSGRRAGSEGAKEIAGVEEAFLFKELPEQLEKYLTGMSHFYFDYGSHGYQALKGSILEIVRSRRVQKLTSTQNLIGELRLFKSEDEIKLMRQAAQITSRAHTEAMKLAKAGTPEYALEGFIEGYFKQQGGNWAYSSIVAGGDNATILHYVANDQLLKKGDLLLIDAGCEFNYYAADITRTFPVESKFSSPQKEIYQIVLDAQYAAIERTKVRGASFDSVHEEAVKVLAKGLSELKLLEGSPAEIIEKQSYRKFYMHRTSHWLGLDVHDLGSYQEPGSATSRILRSGMVLTIEPGLYFDPEDESIPAPYRGIGVRIEDDVLITAEGIEVLTEGTPKTVQEIESLVV